MSDRSRRAVCWLTALAAALVLSGDAGRAQPGTRIVAIGDIHGAYEEFVRILTRTGLIDAQQRWAGGRTTLVQTGDYTDRGAGVRQVFDLLMALEDGARRGQGETVILLGNHEVMNIIGDTRDVTPEIVGFFADGKSESRREQAWKQYDELVAARAKVRPTLPPAYRQTREAWMAAHPPGWLEYREALGPRGKYGRWLRTKPIAAAIDGTIFMHAGISPDRPATVDEVNQKARQEMAAYETYLSHLVEAKLALPFFTLNEVIEVSASELEAAGRVMEAAKAKGEAPDLSGFNVPVLREAIEILKIGEWSLLAAEGPLWFRGYATWPEDDTSRAKVTAFFTKFNIKRFVIGHTPARDGRITPRFGGRVIPIDTGMLVSYFKGRPSALEIRGEQLSAIYEDGTFPLSASTTPPRAAAR